MLLIPEGEGQDLFPPVPPIPSFPALGRLEYTYWKGGGLSPSSLLLYTARKGEQWQWLLVASSRSVATWGLKVVRS